MHRLMNAEIDDTATRQLANAIGMKSMKILRVDVADGHLVGTLLFNGLSNYYSR